MIKEIGKLPLMLLDEGEGKVKICVLYKVTNKGLRIAFAF